MNFLTLMMIISILLFSSCAGKKGKSQIESFPQSKTGQLITPKLKQVKIMPRSSWNAQEARPFKTHKPVRITVHHEGGKVLKKSDLATQRLKNIQTWCMGEDRGWADIPYHYLIAPDGTVYQGRDPLTVGETNTDYDPSGHLLISFLGNYNQQELDENLLQVLTQLIAGFCEQYSISAETIATHQDYCTHTNCPGEHIYTYFENNYVKNKVKEILKSKGL